MAEKVGEAEIEIVADTTKAEREVSGLGDKLGPSISKLGAAIGGAIAVDAVFELGKGAFEAAMESQKIGKQTEAVIKSMGLSASVSAEQIGEMAEALSKKNTVDDEAIQQGANLLLTFGNLAKSAGQSGGAFERANQVMVDMAAAMGTDVSSGAIQLGKALNDPVKGITALTRVGVSFTEQQKEQIKAMAEAGDIAGAQSIILAELERQFGGSAAAQATATDRMKIALGNLQEEIGARLIPAVEKFSTWAVEVGLPAVQKFIEWIDANVIPVIEAVFRGIQAAIEAAVGWWRRNWDTIREVVQTTLDVLRGIVQRGIDAIQGFWRTFGDAIVGFVQRAFDNIRQYIEGAVEVIRGIIQTFTAVLRGDWSAAWDGLVSIVTGVWDMIQAVVDQAINTIRLVIETGMTVIAGIFDAAWSTITAVLTAAWDAIVSFFTAIPGRLTDALGDLGGFIWSALQAGWAALQSALQAMWDAVVTFIGGIPSRVVTALGDLGSTVWNAITTGWSALQTSMQSMWDNFVTFVAGVPGRVTGALGDLGGWIWGQISGGFSALTSNVRRAVDDIVGFFAGLPGRITGLLADITSAAMGVGSGIVNAIADGANRAVGWVGDFSKALADAFKGALGKVWNPIASSIEKGLQSAVDAIDVAAGPWLNISDNLVRGMLPRIHTGGVVPGSRGKEVMAMLQGGEVVFTPSQMAVLGKVIGGAVGGGAPTLALTVHVGQLHARDADSFGQALGAAAARVLAGKSFAVNLRTGVRR